MDGKQEDISCSNYLNKKGVVMVVLYRLCTALYNALFADKSQPCRYQ